MSKLYEKIHGNAFEYIETGYSVAQFDRLIRDRDDLLLILEDLGKILEGFGEGEGVESLIKIVKRKEQEVIGHLRFLIKNRAADIEAARTRAAAPTSVLPVRLSEDGARRIIEDHLLWLEGEGNNRKAAEALKVLLYSLKEREKP